MMPNMYLVFRLIQIRVQSNIKLGINLILCVE